MDVSTSTGHPFTEPFPVSCTSFLLCLYLSSPSYVPTSLHLIVMSKADFGVLLAKPFCNKNLAPLLSLLVIPVTLPSILFV